MCTSHMEVLTSFSVKADGITTNHLPENMIALSDQAHVQEPTQLCIRVCADMNLAVSSSWRVSHQWVDNEASRDSSI